MTLTNDCYRYIFSYFDTTTLAKVARVCHNFKRIIDGMRCVLFPFNAKSGWTLGESKRAIPKILALCPVSTNTYQFGEAAYFSPGYKFYKRPDLDELMKKECGLDVFTSIEPVADGKICMFAYGPTGHFAGTKVINPDMTGRFIPLRLGNLYNINARAVLVDGTDIFDIEKMPIDEPFSEKYREKVKFSGEKQVRHMSDKFIVFNGKPTPRTKYAYIHHRRSRKVYMYSNDGNYKGGPRRVGGEEDFLKRDRILEFNNQLYFFPTPGYKWIIVIDIRNPNRPRKIRAPDVCFERHISDSTFNRVIIGGTLFLGSKRQMLRPVSYFRAPFFNNILYATPEYILCVDKNKRYVEIKKE